MIQVYYNEFDPFAAAWLKALIDKKLIPAGDVDTRDIKEVKPDDIKKYTQCHFFAGIGGWAYALSLADWGERPVWTGSCPCQGFSVAGKGAGFADERHLWPIWFELIRECHPPIVFGEQVASPAALAWLDLVQTDMEGTDYAVGAADLCAAGVGSPHIRQRLYFVADSLRAGRAKGWAGAGDRPATGGSSFGSLADLPFEQNGAYDRQPQPGGEPQEPIGGFDLFSELGISNSAGSFEGRQGSEAARQRSSADAASSIDKLAHHHHPRSQRRSLGRNSPGELAVGPSSMECEKLPGPLNGFWRDADWLHCRDGKWRPVESGTFPLANGVSNRVGKLCGYGNAIVAPLAAEFIKSYMEVENERRSRTTQTAANG